MDITINIDQIEKAVAIIEDYIIKSELDATNKEDLKLLKLVEAREQNPRFEYDLAEMICGEDGNSFPYRSSYFLTQFFQQLGFNLEHDGTTRRFWVEDQLKRLNIKAITKVIRQGLFNKRDFRTYAKKDELEFESIYPSAINEFRSFIDDCIKDTEQLDLAYLLNMNVNTDLLFNQKIQTKDVELNNLIEESKQRFYTKEDKQIALEKIWDAFERVKTYYNTDKKSSAEILTKLVATDITQDDINKEFRSLTEIGNKYRIRHHEQGKIKLEDQSQIEYLFFRVLCLLDLCFSKIKENGD